MRAGSEASHSSEKQSLAFHSHVNRNNRPEQASSRTENYISLYQAKACQIKTSSAIVFFCIFFLAEKFGGTSSFKEKSGFVFTFPFRFSSCFSVAVGRGVHTRLDRG